MNDLINRQDALNFKATIIGSGVRSGKTVILKLFEAYQDYIKSLPSAQPEQGEWVYGENEYGNDGWYCNQCGHWILWDYHVSVEDAEKDVPNFCPNCGADMRGDEDEMDS